MLSLDSLAVHAGRDGLTGPGRPRRAHRPFHHGATALGCTTAALPTSTWPPAGRTWRAKAPFTSGCGIPPWRALKPAWRCWREHPGGRGLRHRHGGPERRAARSRGRRQEARRGGPAALRRQRPHPRLGGAGNEVTFTDAGGRPRCAPARHRTGRCGNPGQPQPGPCGHRRACGRGGRRARARGQHLCHPRAAAAARARRRTGAAQCHQVHGRPRRRDGRRGGGGRRSGPAACARSGPSPAAS